MQYRQGDVLLVAVQDVPAGAVPVPRRDGSVVLAEGEATGHLHAIADPNAELLALPAEEAEEVERRFLRIVGGTATLPSGSPPTTTGRCGASLMTATKTCWSWTS